MGQKFHRTNGGVLSVKGLLMAYRNRRNRIEYKKSKKERKYEEELKRKLDNELVSKMSG